MKEAFMYILLIALISFSNSLPHFIYDGVESYKECSQETEYISFNIYGTLTEELDEEKMKVDDYILEDMGSFKCSLLLNKDSNNERRKHRIECKIQGIFERKGYILVEPKVEGFDFNKENGETSWPDEPEQKHF